MIIKAKVKKSSDSNHYEEYSVQSVGGRFLFSIYPLVCTVSRKFLKEFAPGTKIKIHITKEK